MKHRTYHREELDTFDEILKEMQILRDEVVREFEVVDNALTELSSRIAKLEKPPPKKPIPKKKKKQPSAKNKKK